MLLGLLASYGLCFGLMNDKAAWLTDPLIARSEFVGRMLQCPYCTGFHTGWMTWLVLWGSGQITEVTGGTFAGSLGHLILWCFASAAFCYLADITARRMEA